jgi:hypothetical protein
LHAAPDWPLLTQPVDLDGAVAVAEDAAIDPTGGRNLNGGIITDNLNSASVSEEQIRSAV